MLNYVRNFNFEKLTMVIFGNFIPLKYNIENDFTNITSTAYAMWKTCSWCTGLKITWTLVFQFPFSQFTFPFFVKNLVCISLSSWYKEMLIMLKDLTTSFERSTGQNIFVSPLFAKSSCFIWAPENLPSNFTLQPEKKKCYFGPTKIYFYDPSVTETPPSLSNIPARPHQQAVFLVCL